MGLHTYLSNSNDILITTDGGFVWQCITFLLGADLITFAAVGLGIIAFCLVVKAFINIMED